MGNVTGNLDKKVIVICNKKIIYNQIKQTSKNFIHIITGEISGTVPFKEGFYIGWILRGEVLYLYC